jgi:hypothetical protein
MKLTVMPIKKKTWGGRTYYVHIQIESRDDRLTLHGVEGALASGNCLGSSGQIDMHLRHEKLGEDYELVPPWTEEMFRKLLELWGKWHLNDLHAGCEHQRELGWEKESYDTHPAEPCPVCGYKYGTGWHTVPVPDGVTTWLFALPKAAKPCQWSSYDND